MSILQSDELRLAYAVGLNALVFFSAYRLSRRWNPDRVGALSDSFLLVYLVQYVAVCLPGVAGFMHAATIAAIALLAAGGMWSASRPNARRPAIPLPPTDRWIVRGCGFFVMGYLAALVHLQWYLPVMSNDALTYQMPAAVQWLATGKLGLYEAWFYNPANTFSPLAGSAFIAWLVAPLGNDVLARFVEAGPLLFLFVAMVQLGRALGARPGVAALMATAAVLARPFVNQAILTKDDLFVAAFFIAAVVALLPDRAADSFGPWRAGIALGLLLATKYTAVYALPVLAVALDGPWRAHWRLKQWLIAIAATLLLAGPWYARNWILIGNPLYPVDVRIAGIRVFRGMFQVQRSELLSSSRGLWNVLTAGYFSAPAVVNFVLIIAWIAALFVARRRILNNAALRVVVFGPVAGIALFAFTAPYGEMRFAYPPILMLFACIACAVSEFFGCLQLAVVAALALVFAATAFSLHFTVSFIGVGAIACALGWAIPPGWNAARRLPALRTAMAIFFALCLVFAVYVNWHAYIERYRLYDSYEGWRPTYGDVTAVWRFVREQLPAKSKVAYTNSYFVYPLMGFQCGHSVFYVPTRRDLDSFTRLPRFDQPVTGEQIPQKIAQLLRDNPDPDQWLSRIYRSGAEYIIIFTKNPADPDRTVPPAELEYAQSDPAHFEKLFANPAGAVYRIRPRQ